MAGGRIEPELVPAHALRIPRSRSPSCRPDDCWARPGNASTNTCRLCRTVAESRANRAAHLEHERDQHRFSSDLPRQLPEKLATQSVAAAVSRTTSSDIEVTWSHPSMLGGTNRTRG